MGFLIFLLCLILLPAALVAGLLLLPIALKLLPPASLLCLILGFVGVCAGIPGAWIFLVLGIPALIYYVSQQLDEENEKDRRRRAKLVDTRARDLKGR